MGTSAIVARRRTDGLEYFVGGCVASSGSALAHWTPKEGEAARFVSVREATRTALMLPGRYRAFALPDYAHASPV